MWISHPHGVCAHLKQAHMNLGANYFESCFFLYVAAKCWWEAAPQSAPWKFLNMYSVWEFPLVLKCLWCCLFTSDEQDDVILKCKGPLLHWRFECSNGTKHLWNTVASLGALLEKPRWYTPVSSLLYFKVSGKRRLRAHWQMPQS